MRSTKRSSRFQSNNRLIADGGTAIYPNSQFADYEAEDASDIYTFARVTDTTNQALPNLIFRISEPTSGVSFETYSFRKVSEIDLTSVIGNAQTMSDQTDEDMSDEDILNHLRQAVADVNAGRTRPAREWLADLRKKLADGDC